MKPIVISKGYQGTVTLFEDKVIIEKSGWYAITKTIEISDIIDVTFTFNEMPAGFIEFVTLDSKVSVCRDDAMRNPNALCFKNQSQHGDAVRIQEYILKQIEKRKYNQIQKTQTAIQSTAVSSADEIKKYKELLDMGIITQEEFDAKKKQLLGI